MFSKYASRLWCSGRDFQQLSAAFEPAINGSGASFSRKPPRSRARLAASSDFEAKAAMLNRATPPEQPKTSNEVSFTFW